MLLWGADVFEKAIKEKWGGMGGGGENNKKEKGKKRILYLAVNKMLWPPYSFFLSAGQVYSFRLSQGKLIFCDQKSSAYQN